MKENKIVVKYRRYREGITDYRRRLNMLKSRKPRFVIRKSLNHITVQVVNYESKGDKILLTVNSSSLEKYGWNLSKKNVPAAYLTGLLAGKKSQELKIEDAVIDFGRISNTRGSKIYAVIKGIIDSGVKIKASEHVLPKDDRIKGGHIEKFAKELKESDPERFKKIYSVSIKKKAKPEEMTKAFEETKQKILK